MRASRRPVTALGRDPASVRLLPVSKTKPEASIRLAHAAGCRLLGENKPQEAYRKWEALADLEDLQWSVIGHLQTNKAKLVARFATEFQALDSLRVAGGTDRRLQIEGRALMCSAGQHVRRGEHRSASR
jgi:uncharacterized pyridoxal phosphate-containing UPF0001 family protein